MNIIESFYLDKQTFEEEYLLRFTNGQKPTLLFFLPTGLILFQKLQLFLQGLVLILQALNLGLLQG